MNKLILRKINHKPLLIEKIFPYTINRPLIFLILLQRDISLKESLKTAFKSLKKTNNFDNETNETFNRFISYRLIFEKNLYEEYIINFSFIFGYIKNAYYYNFFKTHFKDAIYHNMDYKYQINNDLAINNFILDYSQYHKKFCLYISNGLQENIEFLKKLNYLEFDIDLIFFIDKNIGGFYDKDDKIKSELIKLNFKVKNICFMFVLGNDKKNQIILKQLKDYIDIINKLKNKNNIKKINIQYLQDRENFLINYLFENNINIKLENLDKVEYIEDKYLTVYKKFNLRYKLRTIFNNKDLFNLIIITPEDFNNIKEITEAKKNNLINKLNLCEQNNNNNNTDLKIILFDFQNNSPYQENFIFFCEKCLFNINNINIIVIRNFGKINFKLD